MADHIDERASMKARGLRFHLTFINALPHRVLLCFLSTVSKIFHWHEYFPKATRLLDVNVPGNKVTRKNPSIQFMRQGNAGMTFENAASRAVCMAVALALRSV
jgi:hypothetical protein